MKLLIITLLSCISATAFAQKKYIPDNHVDIRGERGDYIFTDYYSNKVLANHVKVDGIVTDVTNGLMGFRKGDKYGLISIYGKIVKPAEFDPIEIGSDTYPMEVTGDYFRVRKGDLQGLIDSTGTFALPLGTYGYMWDSGKGTCGAERNELFGLFRNGKAIAPMIYPYGYNEVEFEYQTLPLGNDSLVGLINPFGKFVLPFEYNSISELDNYWIIQKDGLAGLADFNGKIITPCMFDNITRIEGDLIFATKNGKYGIQKLDGTIVCPFEYERLSTDVVDGVTFAMKNNKHGILSLADPAKTDFIYDNNYLPYWNEDKVAVLKKGEYWGMVNTRNEVLIDFLYSIRSEPIYFTNGMAIVSQNGLFGIFSEEGKLVIPCEYEELDTYFPAHVKKNGKYGLIDRQGKLIVPTEFDEISNYNYDNSYLVERNGKQGIYVPEEGLLIPTSYDVIQSDRGNYLVSSGNQYGMLDEHGKQLLPCSFDSIYHFIETSAIVNRNGVLEQYDLTTGKQQTLMPDSIIRFETTAFMTFGKTFNDETVQTAHNFMNGYTPGTWYCVNLKTNAVIGNPYVSIGLFNEQGEVAAITSNFAPPMAINSKGEELKPKFHLVQEYAFGTFIFDEGMKDQDSIIAQFEKRGLLNHVSKADQWNHIQSNYKVFATSDYYYDEMGESVPATYLIAYEKDSYFDSQTTLPKKPVYEYNFQEYYSQLSDANEKGWHWAIPRTAASYDNYEPVNMDFEQVVLINDDGTEISKPNYQPKQSDPITSSVFNQEVQWENLESYPDVLDSIQAFYPRATTLSRKAFLEQYKDSVFAEISMTYDYSDELGETQSYNTSYYDRNSAQTFRLPPPSTIEYQFHFNDIHAMKGGELWGQPERINQFLIDNKIAYSFSSKRYFAYPIAAVSVDKSTGKKIADQLLQTTENESIKADLRKFDYWSELIDKGIANISSEDISEGTLLETIALAYSEDFVVYEYSSATGLAFENEVLLEPKYLSIGIDPTNKGTSGTNFIVTDSLFNVYSYNMNNRKLSKQKDAHLSFSKFENLIIQSKSSKRYNVYNTGVNDPYYWWNRNKIYTKTNAIKDVKRFYYLENCNSFPLSNIYGEDSISYDENGVMQFIYINYCDTLVSDQYSEFPETAPFSWYELADGSVYRYTGEKEDTVHFSDFIKQMRIPINEVLYHNFMVNVTDDGLELNSFENKSMQLSETEYLKVKDLLPGDNGFGGIFKKGKFIPYQTMVPFPEKHKVYIHISDKYWLVGDEKVLELVALDETGSTITGRYSEKFHSYENFMEESAVETESVNPVYLFMWGYED